MLFRLIIVILAFAVPFGIYYVYWCLFFSKNINTHYQKKALTIAFASGFLLLIGYLIYLSQESSFPLDGTFVPATLDNNGNIINSHVK